MSSIVTLLAQRPRKIDELTRPEHQALTADDACFYLAEYVAEGGYSTPINDLILNFKIKPSELVRNPARARYKAWACHTIATALTEHLSRLSAGSVVVPVPTSKVRGHADYDDRLLRALAAARPSPPLDVRELIRQHQSTEADHMGGRQTYAQLLENCHVDMTLAQPAPGSIVLFDDVITDGKHFRVCKELLQRQFGPIRVRGLFIARRVRRDVTLEFESLDL